MTRKPQNHSARKRFGQHFLVDPAIIDKMIAAIAPQRGEQVVEIGPGLGALTGPLLARLDTLTAVELDRDLVTRLAARFGPRLRLHAGDALTFNFAPLASPDPAKLLTSLPSQPTLRIVGNLPYNISSPLLFHLMDFAEQVIDQHFMLQSEVVARMVAQPGSKAYGRLSVMLQYRYMLEKVFDVLPQSFAPAPKVDSAVVRMIPRAAAALPEVDPAALKEVVAAAFSQRRKMLRNTLIDYRDKVDFDALGFDLSHRAEDVPVAAYVALAQGISAARLAR